MKLPLSKQPAYTPPTHPHIILLQNNIETITGEKRDFAVQQGTSDLGWTTQVFPGIEFGAEADGIHGARESVSISSLKETQMVHELYLDQL